MQLLSLGSYHLSKHHSTSTCKLSYVVDCIIATIANLIWLPYICYIAIGSFSKHRLDYIWHLLNSIRRIAIHLLSVSLMQNPFIKTRYKELKSQIIDCDNCYCMTEQINTYNHRNLTVCSYCKAIHCDMYWYIATITASYSEV